MNVFFSEPCKRRITVSRVKVLGNLRSSNRTKSVHLPTVRWSPLQSDRKYDCNCHYISVSEILQMYEYLSLFLRLDTLCCCHGTVRCASTIGVEYYRAVDWLLNQLVFTCIAVSHCHTFCQQGVLITLIISSAKSYLFACNWLLFTLPCHSYCGRIRSQSVQVM